MEFKMIIDACINVLKIPVTLYGYSVTLYELFFWSVVAFLLLYLWFYILK